MTGSLGKQPGKSARFHVTCWMVCWVTVTRRLKRLGIERSRIESTFRMHGNPRKKSPYMTIIKFHPPKIINPMTHDPLWVFYDVVQFHQVKFKGFFQVTFSGKKVTNIGKDPMTPMLRFFSVFVGDSEPTFEAAFRRGWPPPKRKFKLWTFLWKGKKNLQVLQWKAQNHQWNTWSFTWVAINSLTLR